jgi:cyanate permease
MPLFSLVLKKHPPQASIATPQLSAMFERPLGFSPNALTALLVFAGVTCCVAMAVPQVHMIAYCIDLGYGATTGAEVLAIVLGCGVASRLIFGSIADRIGALQTALLGSALQAFTLALFVPFDGIRSIYVISALFGLFQGGIVPSYALIVSKYFDPAHAGQRIAIVLMSTLLGMGLGGWIAGALYDVSGSYRLAFVNGVAWNVLNLIVLTLLLHRSTPRVPGSIAGGVLPQAAQKR